MMTIVTMIIILIIIIVIVTAMMITVMLPSTNSVPTYCNDKTVPMMVMVIKRYQ